MNEKNNINLAKSASEEISERKKMQKAALIKIGAMLVLSAILFIFSSMHMTIKQMTAETA